MNQQAGFICICPQKALEFDEDGTIHRARCPDMEKKVSSAPFKARMSTVGDGALASSSGAAVYEHGGVIVAFVGELKKDVGYNTIRRGCKNSAEFIHKLFVRYEGDFLSKIAKAGDFSLVCYDSNRARVLAATEGATDLFVGHDAKGTTYAATYQVEGIDMQRLPARHYSYGTRSPLRSYTAKTTDEAVAKAKSAAAAALAGILKPRNAMPAAAAAAPVKLNHAAAPFVPSAMKARSPAKGEAPPAAAKAHHIKVHTTPSVGSHAADKASTWKRRADPAEEEEAHRELADMSAAKPAGARLSWLGEEDTCPRSPMAQRLPFWGKPEAKAAAPKAAAPDVRKLAVEAVSELARIVSSEKIQALMSVPEDIPSPRASMSAPSLPRSCSSSNMLDEEAGGLGGMRRVSSRSNLGPAH